MSYVRAITAANAACYGLVHKTVDIFFKIPGSVYLCGAFVLIFVSLIFQVIAVLAESFAFALSAVV